MSAGEHILLHKLPLRSSAVQQIVLLIWVTNT